MKILEILIMQGPLMTLWTLLTIVNYIIWRSPDWNHLFSLSQAIKLGICIVYINICYYSFDINFEEDILWSILYIQNLLGIVAIGFCEAYKSNMIYEFIDKIGNRMNHGK